MTNQELKNWMPDDELYKSEWEVNADDFESKVKIVDKTKTIFPDIKTCLDTMTMISKLTPAVAKLETLSKEELEIAGEKIRKWEHYTDLEKEYLKNIIIKLYENN